MQRKILEVGRQRHPTTFPRNDYDATAPFRLRGRNARVGRTCRWIHQLHASFDANRRSDGLGEGRRQDHVERSDVWNVEALHLIDVGAKFSQLDSFGDRDTEAVLDDGRYGRKDSFKLQWIFVSASERSRESAHAPWQSVPPDLVGSG
jgi:hypothetical protein